MRSLKVKEKGKKEKKKTYKQPKQGLRMSGTVLYKDTLSNSNE